MDFLKKYGLNDKQIDSIITKYDYDTLELFSDANKNVQMTIEYMLDFGITNIYEVLYYNLSFFFKSPNDVDKLFSNYDKNELLYSIKYNPEIINNLE